MNKKKLIAILTLMCFMFTFMPVAAFADTTPTVYIAGTAYTQNDGKTTPSGVSIDWTQKTITLDNANINYTAESTENTVITVDNGYFISALAIIDGENSWTLNLNNSNTVNASCSDTKYNRYSVCPVAGLYASGNLTITGSGTLNVDASYTGTLSSEQYLCGIYANGDLTFNAETVNASVTNNMRGAKSPYLGVINALKTIDVNGGTLNISIGHARGTGLVVGSSIMGDINLEEQPAEGTFDLNVTSGTIKIEDKATSGTNRGMYVIYVNISGGTLEIKGDNSNSNMANVGIDSAFVNITGGEVSIEDYAYSGISTMNLTISGESTSLEIETEAQDASAIIAQGQTTISSEKVTIDVPNGNAVSLILGGSLNATAGSYTGNINLYSERSDVSTATISGENTKINGNITMSGTSNNSQATALTISNGASVTGTVSTSKGAMVKTTDNEGNTVYSNYKDVETAKEAAIAVKEGTTVESITVPNESEDVEDNNKPMVALTYTVTFNTDGGSDVAAQKVEWNKTATAPAEPTKDGYTFIGWYNGETKFDFDNTAVTEDITLTAKWEEKSQSSTSTPSTSSGGGFSGKYNYAVNASVSGADVTLSDNYAVAGETVTITIDPDMGKKVDEVIVTDADGDIIPVTKAGDNKYTFVMPEGKVNVSVTTENADYDQRIVLQINNKNIVNNNKTITNDVSPVIVGDRTLVPVRIVTELLGGAADWDADTRTVTLTIDGKVLKLVIDEEIPGYGTGATIINDRTYVPIRYISEMLGAEVEWIAATQQIVIEK